MGMLRTYTAIWPFLGVFLLIFTLKTCYIMENKIKRSKQVVKKLLIAFIAAFIIGGLITAPPIKDEKNCTNEYMGPTDPILFHGIYKVYNGKEVV